MKKRMEKEFINKTILVTGGTGSIGSELVRQLLQYKPKQIRVFSRSENMQHLLREELGGDVPVIYLIGDIRDRERLSFAFKEVDIVLHAAAMKHVHLCEYNPFEAVKTNIVGSQNVIDAAIERGVKKVISISTDKAANPAGVLGTSKLMMEKLFINANNYSKPDETKFACVRFGNILWSNGSVLHTWKEQVERENRIKITDKAMTRFFMSKEEAISLVLKGAVLTQGGEMFTFKMPAIGLADLAKLFIEKYAPDRDVAIDVMGNRGGEKVHEDLFDESNKQQHILTGDDMYIVIMPKYLSSFYNIPHEEVRYDGFEKVEDRDGFTSSDYIDIERIKKSL